MLTVSHICSKEALKNQYFYCVKSGVISCSVRKRIIFCAYFLGKICIFDPHYLCQNIIIFIHTKYYFKYKVKLFACNTFCMGEKSLSC